MEYFEKESECFRNGVAGKCNPMCEVYLAGLCAEPEAMAEKLGLDEIEQHNQIYRKGGSANGICI